MSEPSQTPSPPADAANAPAVHGLTRAWEHLRHHKVMQWTLAYAAAAYTLLHGVEMLSEAQGWPHLIVRVLSLVLVLGVPLIVTLAWYHGAKGLQKVSGPELTIITILLFIAGTLLWAFSRPNAESQNVAAVERPATATTDTASVSTVPAAPRAAVAVLPFANLTGDASKEYLGDGMADELINTLNKVPGLKVPARTSTFAYKGRNTDIRQIAKDLGVGTILEGSVKAAGKRLRITAQLINAQDGLHLWSESYDEEFTDIFKLQDKLATQIASALQPNLTGAAEAAVAQGPPTQDVEAYNLYLQGVSLVQRTSAENAARAVEYFEQALQRDPKFARAYAMIAEAQIGGTNSDSKRTNEYYAAAERAARQALAMDPTLANPHTALAGISGHRGQYLEMETHLRAALTLAPNDGFIHAVVAFALAASGRLREGLEESRKAYALAPANPLVVAYAAYLHAVAGHETEALRLATAARDLGYPVESDPLSGVYIYSALHAKRYGEAADLIDAAINRSDPEQARAAQVLRRVLTALADPSQRPAALAAATLPPTRETRLSVLDPCLESSASYALLGALDNAYTAANRCFDRAATDRVFGLFAVTWLFWTPELRAFRADPRFQAFITRLGLMPYYQQYGPPDDCDLKDGKLTCR